MASGAIIDCITEEFGIRFIPSAGRIEGRHQSKARRTCQKLLKNHGPEHLRLVLGLMSSKKNRGNWAAPAISAVSWLVLNKPAVSERADFLDLFDQQDIEKLMTCAKQVNPKALTESVRILLSYEMERMVSGNENAGRLDRSRGGHRPSGTLAVGMPASQRFGTTSKNSQKTSNPKKQRGPSARAGMREHGRE